jgi:secreted trypsin-like serine protease
LLTLVLAALAAGCAAPASEAVADTESSVIGGRATNSAQPAVGYLAVAQESGPFCTATLVAPTYIVTAAHCVRGSRASSLVFGTGAFDATRRRTDIKRCKSNSAYRDSSEATLVHDFAFCELASAPDGIEPLAFVAEPAFAARYLAIGYGQTDPDDEDSIGPRRQLTVHRVDPEDEPLLEGLEGMLSVTSARGDTCFGDSGGPLLVVDKKGVARVAGVLHAGISDGDGDCGAGGIGLYAPVAENVAFFGTR